MDRISTSTSAEEIKNLDNLGKLKRNLVNAAIKDTVTVPDGGYTIIRFLADNPGFWLFHCHIEFHAEVGMSLVFKVGETSQMPKVPKNFPTCSDYVPASENFVSFSNRPVIFLLLHIISIILTISCNTFYS